MKTEWKNEHASCRVVQNTELPSDMERVREVVSVWTDEDHRRQGYGTELMQAVCDEADVEGMVLILQPRPYGTDYSKCEQMIRPSLIRELDEHKLIAWYHRFGFINTQNKPVLMARAPSFCPRVTGVVHAVDGMLRG